MDDNELGLSSMISAVVIPGVLMTSDRVGRCEEGARKETFAFAGVAGTGRGLHELDVDEDGELDGDSE
jgi:hypothetical protein